MLRAEKDVERSLYLYSLVCTFTNYKTYSLGTHSLGTPFTWYYQHKKVSVQTKFDKKFTFWFVQSFDFLCHSQVSNKHRLSNRKKHAQKENLNVDKLLSAVLNEKHSIVRQFIAVSAPSSPC